MNFSVVILFPSIRITDEKNHKQMNKQVLRIPSKGFPQALLFSLLWQKSQLKQLGKEGFVLAHSPGFRSVTAGKSRQEFEVSHTHHVKNREKQMRACMLIFSSFSRTDTVQSSAHKMARTTVGVDLLTSINPAKENPSQTSKPSGHPGLGTPLRLFPGDFRLSHVDN